MAGALSTRLVGMFAPVRRSRLCLVLGAFALLGLFAMHGLGGHGLHHGAVNGSDHDTATSISVAMSSAGHDDFLGVGDGCDGACGTNAAPDAREGGGDWLGGWTLMLCLGLLVAGVVAPLFARRGLRPESLRVTPGSQTAAHRRSSARAHDPPCLYSISVQRC